MEVRCPKCRLKFEVTATAGMKELLCVCPRCGNPFTYKVPADREQEDVPVAQTTATPDAQPVDAGPSSQVQEPTLPPGWKNPTPFTPSPNQAGPIPPPYQPRSTQHSSLEEGKRQASQIPPSSFGVEERKPVSQRKNSGCCLKGCLIAAFVVLALLFFAFKSCDSDVVYHGNGHVDSEEQDTTQQLGREIDQLSEDDFTKVHDEKAPDWIQGTWVVETDYGDITVKIHGKHISETSANKTIHGSYYYENQQLNCDYGDGSFFIYKVDVDGKRIDAGDGMYMHKVN